ncbi:Cytochrome P450 [Macleaya cordata]|uniref:Cytochrome P450 n=1 Tax=Macleaya cordata TaxID=56857 RepID=A0A200QUS2_MACCD|nr:Cytochrome P450 [Macleaya cordata]
MESPSVIFMSLLASLFKRWPEFLLALLSFFSIKWYSKHKNNLSSLNWPFLGRLPSVLRNAHCVNEVLLDTFNIFGSSFKLKGPVFTRMNYLITCHPQNIEYILKTNFSNFPKGQEFKEIFDIFGDGIFTTDFYPWIQQRKMTHSRFTSKEFRNFVAQVNRSEVEVTLLPLLVHLSKEESTFDLQSVFVRLTFDTSFIMTFGRSPKYLSADFPSNELAEAIEVATETMFYRHVVPSLWWKFMRLLRVGQERENAKARRTIDHEIGELISQKMKELLLLGFGPDKGLLSTYMNNDHSQVGEKSTHKFLRDTALIILFASADTSASGLTWFFWCICNNPRVESKILEELRNVVSKRKNGDDDDDHSMKENRVYVFDPEELKELVYMHAALIESLRLYPPGYLNHKSVVENDVLPDGVRVRKGMKVILSIYAVARMEWIWGKDCKEFKPERWIDEEGKFRSELLSKFFTFNVGPRTCMGKEMAFSLMKSVIAAILFNFHVELVEAQPDCLKQSIVLLMKNGLNVKVRKRVA